MKPAKELLAQVRDRDHWLRGEFPDLELAARVEKVLAEIARLRAQMGGHGDPFLACSRLERLLNGEDE